MFSSCLNQGWIEVIVGGMFSGKSEEMIRRIIRAKYAKQHVLVFNHCWDNRYSNERVVSHTGSNVEAILVSDVKSIRDIVAADKTVKLVAIDEAQFFDSGIIELVEDLAKEGKRVIVAGLDQNFKGEPFKEIMELMARAEVVDKFNAICNVCGSPASRTQRIIDGKPAKYSDPIILVGASECYEPRCRKCHIVKK